MRHVIKTRRGTDALLTAHEQPPQNSEQSTRRWQRFGRENKAALMTLLLNEQYHLCCYSEIRADLRGLGYHIEHVENKSQQPGRTFDYQNLATSALDSANDLPQFGINAFGGHSRGKQEAVDMAKFIHCHMTDCARYFAYLSDGR
ncbi:TIGR02646 family protein, partial [Salmonella enterica subsp. salamae]|nr:TIGR02646 family protein [Salmonella enterica subsp. salamae]